MARAQQQTRVMLFALEAHIGRKVPQNAAMLPRILDLYMLMFRALSMI